MTNINNISFEELSNPVGFDNYINYLNNDTEIIHIDDSTIINKNHDTEIIQIDDSTIINKNHDTEIIHIDDSNFIKKNPDFSKVEDMKDLVLEKFNNNIESNFTNQNIINLPNPFNKDENNCILPSNDDIIEHFNNEDIKKDPKLEKVKDEFINLINKEDIKFIHKDDNSNIFNHPIFNEPILLNINNKLDGYPYIENEKYINIKDPHYHEKYIQIHEKDTHININVNDPTFDRPILLNTNKEAYIHINENDHILKNNIVTLNHEYKNTYHEMINHDIVYHDLIKHDIINHDVYTVDTMINHFDNSISKENQTIFISSF